MEKSEYVQCRLTAATHQRLTAYLERLKAKAAAKPERYRPALSKGKVGLSDAIDQLLYFFDQEESRKRSYTQSRAKKDTLPQPLFDNLEVDRMIAEGCPNAD